jgi:hypothetical protein
MNFLVNVNFNETRSLSVVLVDPDPDEVAAVFCATFDDGVYVFFEAPHDAEVWDILQCALVAFKDFQLSEGV